MIVTEETARRIADALDRLVASAERLAPASPPRREPFVAECLRCYPRCFKPLGHREEEGSAQRQP